MYVIHRIGTDSGHIKGFSNRRFHPRTLRIGSGMMIGLKRAAESLDAGQQTGSPRFGMLSGFNRENRGAFTGIQSVAIDIERFALSWRNEPERGESGNDKRG